MGGNVFRRFLSEKLDGVRGLEKSDDVVHCADVFLNLFCKSVRGGFDVFGSGGIEPLLTGVLQLLAAEGAAIISLTV